MTSREPSRRSDPVMIAALAAGATQQQAAQAAGVSERTVRRRMTSPDFADHLAQARAELLVEATDRLTASVPTAVATLAALMEPDAPPSVRLRAALGSLNTAKAWREATELEQRLQALEDLLADQPGQEYHP